MSYFDQIFTQYIKKDDISMIFELGSMHLQDGIKLHKTYNCPVYSFECNPEGIELCKQNLEKEDLEVQKYIHLIEKAVCEKNEPITFYPFDVSKYNNIGCSSLLKIDFSQRSIDDPDYNRPNPQKEVTVDGTRLDTFMEDNNIEKIDMLCIDLQGYELNALKSLGSKLKNVKYIITECSIKNTYEGGTNFEDLNEYLKSYNFSYFCSNQFGTSLPPNEKKGFCEFDSLFINQSLI
jgi:FkbM family methyltransferase